MSKKNRISINCPCCKQKTEQKRLTKVNSLLPFSGFMAITDRSYLEAFMFIVGKYPNFYQWACDNCIKNQKAILANPNKQKYTFKNPMDSAAPYLAYFDRGFTCKTCTAKTIFSKEEQQYWYEELSFVVYSKPITCEQCRKELRAEKHLNTELSTLLSDGKPKEKSKLLRIAAIYKEMGKLEKMKQYLAAAKKVNI